MPSGEKIRVMIVDDVSETRENVRKLLQFESDVDVVGVARTGKEAIQLSQELNPDVVLMDINMPGTVTIRSHSVFSRTSSLPAHSDVRFAGNRPLSDYRQIGVSLSGEELHHDTFADNVAVVRQPVLERLNRQRRQRNR